ncbi:hypothetical protein GCM10027589_05060 [Actinocorallia lasiicapitis]
MDLISPTRRSELIWTSKEVRKLELLDDYPADAELFSAWRSGDVAAVERIRDVWRAKLADESGAGLKWRRVRVISEPLSEYQRMAVEIALPEEDLRWLPRRLVSAIPLPANDCFVLDSEAVIFNVHGGDGQRSEIQLSLDEQAVAFCRDAFDVVWSMAVPTSEYQARLTLV